MSGHIYRRGRTWSVMWDEPRQGSGKRRQRQKGGFRTRKEAEAFLATTISSLARGTYISPDRLTLGEYLEDQWLPSLTVRSTTARSYEGHVTNYLVPLLGKTRLQELSPSRMETFFATLPNHGKQRPLSVSTVHRIRATLRRALNDAVRKGLLARNPAADLRLPSPPRHEPPVWTAEQVRAFLEATAEDRLHPLYVFILLTGVRRGEAAAVKWSDIDLDHGRVRIRRQIVDNGYAVYVSEPKTRKGERAFTIDDRTVGMLRSLKAQQARERLAWGPAYEDQDFVFTRENGTPLHPDHITNHLRVLIGHTSLPQVTVHQLRHTHASLALAAGVEPRVISERLGHSSVAFTLDTYVHLLPALEKDAAQKTSAYIYGTGG